MKSYLISKIGPFIITLITCFLSDYFLASNNLIDLIAVLFVIDIGHFILGNYYKSKGSIKIFFNYKRIILSLVIVTLIASIFDPLSSAWLVYSLAFVHGMLDERYMLSFKKVEVSRIVIVFPVIAYSVLVYSKLFNLEISPYIILLGFFCSSGCFLYFQLNKKTHGHLYFFIISLIILMMGLFADYIDTKIVIISFLHFHYWSWYFFYYNKTNHKEKYILVAVLTNLLLLIIFFLCWNFFVEKNTFINILSRSFFIPAWFIYHFIYSLRDEDINAFKIYLGKS